MSKKCYTKICYYFGIGPTEEIVQNCHYKFINTYGASDNCLCQLLYHKGLPPVLVFDLHLMYLHF